MIEAKRALRATMRAARMAFAAGRAPLPMPVNLPGLLAGRTTIASYVPLPGEADPCLIASAGTERGLALCLPALEGRHGPMRFLNWAPGDVLMNGPFGTLQPATGASGVIPDIILTPLLGFDRRGNRLGQGAGYYDRAFAVIPGALRIGIAWSVQEVADLPVDPWDVPLHGVITENGWIGAKKQP